MFIIPKYSKSNSLGNVPLIAGLLTPYSWMHKKFVWAAGKDRELVEQYDWIQRLDDFLARAMKRDARTVSGWDFDRIIPCHGVSVARLFIFVDIRGSSPFPQSRM